MNSAKRYTEEFKIEAVKQVTERGHGIYSVASRLGITHSSLYAWIRRYGDQPALQETITDHQAEVNRLKAELKRVTEERDILKKATVSSTCQRNTLLELFCRRIKSQWLLRLAQTT